MTTRFLPSTQGPFRAEQIRSGDPYELSNGHAIHCLPTGGQGSRANLLGGTVLESDPAVEEAGVDTGFTPHKGTLRAPDVAVGNVPNRPGWVPGVPPLALEYADTGQDERELTHKIADLLAAGTKLIWVVRLTGPRRVEVHRPGQLMQLYLPGQLLEAPGILKNPVPVEALYDREAAHEATLRNLLQRRGYASLEAVHAEGEARGEARGRAKGRAEGEAKGKAESLKRLLVRHFGALPDWAERQIEGASLDQLDAWLDGFLDADSLASLLKGNSE